MLKIRGPFVWLVFAVLWDLNPWVLKTLSFTVLGFPVLQNHFCAFGFLCVAKLKTKNPKAWFSAFGSETPKNPVLDLLSVKTVGLLAARVYPPRSAILHFPSRFAIWSFKLLGFYPFTSDRVA